MAVAEWEDAQVQWDVHPLMALKHHLDALLKTPNLLIRPHCTAAEPTALLSEHAEDVLACQLAPNGLPFMAARGQGGEVTLHVAGQVQKRIKRGVDLISADLGSGLLAAYSRAGERIDILRADEKMKQLERTGVEINLLQAGSRKLRWMRLVPGRQMLAIVDEAGRLRVYELGQRALLKARDAMLGEGFTGQACCTPDGNCVLYLRTERVEKKGGEGREETQEEAAVEGTGSGSQADASKESGRSQEGGRGKEALDGEEEEVGIGGKEGGADGKAGAVQAADAAAAGVVCRNEKTGTNQSKPVNYEERLVIDVFKLDSMTRLKTIPLDGSLSGPVEQWEMGVAEFGSQAQLLLLDRGNRTLHHCRLVVSVASTKCRLRNGGSNGAMGIPDGSEARGSAGTGGASESVSRFGGCHSLDHLTTAFEKFATSPYLGDPRLLRIHLLLEDEHISHGSKALLERQVRGITDRLRHDRGKDFSKLRLEGYGCGMSDLAGVAETAGNISCDEWIARLMCLLPIQIARAENNGLKPMIDGLNLSRDLVYADTEALANRIRFGIYDEVLAQWKGPLKVVSSMGKQSSGKSYLLNHLAGSLLSVSGGRCTDGVWMTVREAGGCLYVLMDFEGLGSFERSEQEDMLLSILNAAISSLTIFNKKVRGRGRGVGRGRGACIHGRGITTMA